ncbi:MAG TPA: peptide deformylase [Acidimicrobiales bacterium]|jgi:peptide deformylase|nr:peptide deformylase [Acidimicrobiales bacterium]
MAIHTIRVYGDPVLRAPTALVTDVDAALHRLIDDMIETMYDAPGVGLAANQVGVQKRLFVWDIGDGPGVAINPVVSGHAGEWSYDEGCLSVPGLWWPILRPRQVHLKAQDRDGDEYEVDADDMLARVFLHETDHLDGNLLLSRLDSKQSKEARKALRDRVLDLDPR